MAFKRSRVRSRLAPLTTRAVDQYGYAVGMVIGHGQVLPPVAIEIATATVIKLHSSVPFLGQWDRTFSSMALPWPWTHRALVRGLLELACRQGHVAQLDMTDRMDEPRLAPVSPRLHPPLERGCVRPQRFPLRSIGGRNDGGQRDAFQGDPLLMLFIEAQRACAARQAGEQLHSLEHPADGGDVAVQVAWTVAGDDVELGTIAAVGRVIPACAHYAVAVSEPDLTALGVTSDREAVRPSHLPCVHVAVG